MNSLNNVADKTAFTISGMDFDALSDQSLKALWVTLGTMWNDGYGSPIIMLLAIDKMRVEMKFRKISELF